MLTEECSHALSEIIEIPLTQSKAEQVRMAEATIFRL